MKNGIYSFIFGYIEAISNLIIHIVCLINCQLVSGYVVKNTTIYVYRMFIGPCIIVIVEELETNLMSLVIFITLNICSTCFEN